MSEISRIEYAICRKDGVAFQWFDDKQTAIDFAASQTKYCYVEECIEYYTDRNKIYSNDCIEND